MFYVLTLTWGYDFLFFSLEAPGSPPCEGPSHTYRNRKPLCGNKKKLESSLKTKLKKDSTCTHTHTYMTCPNSPQMVTLQLFIPEMLSEWRLTKHLWASPGKVFYSHSYTLLFCNRQKFSFQYVKTFWSRDLFILSKQSEMLNYEPELKVSSRQSSFQSHDAWNDSGSLHHALEPKGLADIRVAFPSLSPFHY